MRDLIVQTYVNTNNLRAVRFEICKYLGETSVDDDYFYDILFGQLTVEETREAFRNLYTYNFDAICGRMIVQMIKGLK